MLISFLNDVDIQLILEFKYSLGKYQTVFPKHPKRAFFGHPVYLHSCLQGLERV